MAERISRVTPRRLSFSLEDFPGTEMERIDLNITAGNERPNYERENLYFITPTDGRREARGELNLLSGLQAQVKEGEAAITNRHIHDHEVPVKHQDDAQVTQGELRRLLQARREGTTIMLDLEPLLAKEVLATPYPTGQQTCQLVKEWLKEGTIQPRVNRPPLSKEQYDDPSYCVLHRTQGHTTMKCWTIRHAFHRQVRAGKVLLLEKEKEVNDLHLIPLPEHGVNVITSSNNRIHIEEVNEEDDTEERALAVGLSKMRGLCILFGQLGLHREAQQEAAKALVGIIKNHGGELGAINAPLTRLARSHTSAIVFREPVLQGLEFCHNKPLYVEASIEGLKVRRALVDNGS
ncbi:hypothetical protein SESBI_32028 [Sesbania bispinosa]|nr:hypothetical protein SESBI_32028 [Sesbania bispinosa]